LTLLTLAGIYPSLFCQFPTETSVSTCPVGVPRGDDWPRGVVQRGLAVTSGSAGSGNMWVASPPKPPGLNWLSARFRL